MRSCKHRNAAERRVPRSASCPSRSIQEHEGHELAAKLCLQSHVLTADEARDVTVVKECHGPGYRLVAAKHCMSTALGSRRHGLVTASRLVPLLSGRPPVIAAGTRLQPRLQPCLDRITAAGAPPCIARRGAACRYTPLRLPTIAAARRSNAAGSPSEDSDASQQEGPPPVILQHEELPQPPSPLPPPPAADGLLHVLLYSFRICLTERWAVSRLAAVFGLLFVSRMAGKRLCHVPAKICALKLLRAMLHIKLRCAAR